MKKLFTAIRQGKLDEVAVILDKKPELISCLAKAPPKKDDGQSPLMVAIKSDNLEVAHLLLDRGADVNFQDAINPYGNNFSAPVWYDAIVQCYLRAGDYVSERNKERTKEYFLLLRRLLDMGMNPNTTTNPGNLNAWQHALNQYNDFARKSYSSYNTEGDKAHNRQLREMLKAVLDELLKHGADIHSYIPPNKDGFPIVSCLIRNLEEGRELFDSFGGLNPDSDIFKPYTEMYRGKERLVQPYYTVEDYRQWYELKWGALESILRSYYE